MDLRANDVSLFIPPGSGGMPHRAAKALLRVDPSSPALTGKLDENFQTKRDYFPELLIEPWEVRVIEDDCHGFVPKYTGMFPKIQWERVKAFIAQHDEDLKWKGIENEIGLLHVRDSRLPAERAEIADLIQKGAVKVKPEKESDNAIAFLRGVSPQSRTTAKPKLTPEDRRLGADARHGAAMELLKIHGAEWKLKLYAKELGVTDRTLRKDKIFMSRFRGAKSDARLSKRGEL